MSAPEPANPDAVSPDTVLLGAPALAAAFATTAAAVWGAHAGLAPLDAGDLATAAWELGVPHAPGFPLHTLLGKAASWLPFGTVAARVGLLSALLAGASAAAAVVIAAAATRSAAVAWTAALLATVGFSTLPMLGLAARMPEVYTLHTACCLGAFAALTLAVNAHIGAKRAAQGMPNPEKHTNVWAIAALLCGLALCNHPQAAVVVPCVLVLGVGVLRVRQWLAGIAIAAACAPVWAYLPTAAARQPLHNWGNPDTWERFWRHVSAAAIRESFATELAATTGARFARLVQFTDAWAGLFVALALLALVGAAALVRMGHARVAAAALLIVALDTYWSASINPMGLRDWQNGHLTALLLFVLAAVPVGLLIERFQAPQVALQGAAHADLRRGIAAMALALCAVGVPSPAAVRSLGNAASISDAALWHLGHVAPESITTTVSDDLTSAMLFWSVVGDARPDATTLGRWVFSSPETLLAVADRYPVAPVPELMQVPPPAGWTSLPREQWLGQAVLALLQAHLGQREVWWEIAGTHMDLPSNLGVQPQWPVARVLQQGVAMPDPCAQTQRSLCLNDARLPVDPQVLPLPGDVFGGRWASAQWATVARLQASAGQWENAFYTYSQALAFRPESGAVRASMAVCLAAVGQNREALRWSEEALLMDPFSRAAWRNGSRYAAELGDTEAVARLLAHGQRMGWQLESASEAMP